MDPSGEHILHIAANCPDGRMINLLATRWPSYVNTANDDGITPLHVASMYGQLLAIESLLNNNADPFAVDGEAMTPIDWCIKEGHAQCVKYFQDLGIKQGNDEDEIEEDSMAIAYTSMLMETTLIDEYNDSTFYTLNRTDLNDTTIIVEEDDLQQLTNSMIRSELVKMGEKPGPINDLTRGAYLRYLHKVKSGLLPTQTQHKTNSKCFKISYFVILKLSARF